MSSDLHFDFWRKYSKIYPNGTTSRMDNISNVVLGGVKEANSDLVILAGDIIHRSKYIEPILANYVKQFFEKLKDKRVIVFPGNHDLRNTPGGVTSILKPLLPDKVEYIETPYSMDISKDILFHFLPFYPSIDYMKEELSKLKPNYDKINILFTHIMVEKALLKDDFSVGHKWESLKLFELKKFDYVFAGDVHKSQEIENLVFYPGSPLQHTFSEEGEVKKTWKITIGEDTVKKEGIISKAPEFKSFVVEDKEKIKEILEEKKKGNFIRIHSKVSLEKEIDLEGMQYMEMKKEVNIPDSFEFKKIILSYVKQKSEELEKECKKWLI